MAITIEGCDRILEAWRKSGVRLMIGFNMRYMNIFRVMKEIVDSGTIGEIRAAWVRRAARSSRRPASRGRMGTLPGPPAPSRHYFKTTILRVAWKSPVSSR